MIPHYMGPVLSTGNVGVHVPVCLPPQYTLARPVPLASFCGCAPSTPPDCSSGGQRKCVGDQFALMESVVTLSMLIRRFEFELTIKPDEVGFYTGATIHTRNGLPMRVKKRVLPGTSAEGGGEASKSKSVQTGSAVAA